MSQTGIRLHANTNKQFDSQCVDTFTATNSNFWVQLLGPQLIRVTRIITRSVDKDKANISKPFRNGYQLIRRRYPPSKSPEMCSWNGPFSAP